MHTKPLIAVCLGTDHHPFDRLVTWISTLAPDSPWDWFVQHGSTTLPPGVPGDALLSAGGLQDLFERADAVVTHGGPGLIMEARAAGHLPIVVARDPDLGEHVDGHQQRFVARIGRSDLITPVVTRHQMQTAIGRAVTTDRVTPTVFDESDSTVRRFGTLIENLVHHNGIHQPW